MAHSFFTACSIPLGSLFGIPVRLHRKFSARSLKPEVDRSDDVIDTLNMPYLESLIGQLYEFVDT